MIPNSSSVIAWDNNQAQGIEDGPWVQRFTVGNPETQVFVNKTVTIPLGYGDLFCAGHVWLPDGRLFVAGGNTVYPINGVGHYEGSRFCGIWDPGQVAGPTGGWNFDYVVPPPSQSLKAMNKKRWYPTVTLISNTKVMVSGGVESTANHYCSLQNDGAFNTYEVFDIPTNDWERDPATNLPMLYPGPTVANSPCSAVLGEYPRMHFLTTRTNFMSGMFAGATRVRHQPLATAQAWMPHVNSLGHRDYGSSVLLPNVGNGPNETDDVMILGGGYGTYVNGALVALGVRQNSQRIDGASAAPAWQAALPMAYPRMCANAVLLPNGEVVAVGGSTDYYFITPLVPNPPRTPARHAEIYSKQGGWRVDAQQGSPRMYHSTAALLPSGAVVSAGGDVRTSDWEVFVPAYFNNPNLAAPAFAGTWSGGGYLTVGFGLSYLIEHAPLPPGVMIQRVVLMRPCSVTHHSDMDQRYVELVLNWDDEVLPPNTIRASMPNQPNWSGTSRNSVPAPPGFYMAFLITTQGVPSSAKWVRLL